jgi:hypothetical protein
VTGGLALLASQAAGAAGDPAAALAFAEQANARLPPHPPVLITLAEACLMTGDAPPGGQGRRPSPRDGADEPARNSA